MDEKLINEIEHIIVDEINEKNKVDINILFNKIEDYCNSFDHSSNVKGDLFENFCYIYLKRFREFEKVWMYKEIPLDIRNKLNLTTMDYGIDLVCLDKHNNYYAIQAKYRKRQNYITSLSWRKLSTFYAMVHKTGPFVKYIVITTTDKLTNIGKDLKEEEFIGFNQLKEIDLDGWKKISNYSEKKKSLEEIRKKRIDYFDKKDKNND
jgi:predicted helicase